MLFALLLLLPRLALAHIDVAASTPDLAAVAREVVGDEGRVRALSTAAADPHFVDPTPRLALHLSRVDALVVVGAELEVGWLPPLLTGSRNGGIQPGAVGYVDCSRFVRLLGIPQGPVDRSMGDIHPSGNPHYHLDPRAMAACAIGMAERFGELDPEHADLFEANARAFAEEVAQAVARWQARLAPMRGRPVVTYHDSLVYLSDWVGFEVVAHLEPKPGIPPTPRHTAHVLQLMDQRKAGLILQLSYDPPSTARIVADRAGAHLVTLPGGTSDEAETYLENMEEIVKELERAQVSG